MGAWLGTRIVGHAVMAPTALALIAGGAVLLLPRIGFLLLSATLVLAAVVNGQPGEALLLAAALCVPAVLLSRSGTRWPLAAAAPALGAIGLSGAWPALAARAATVWQRAALGFIGWLWVVAAELLSGARLLLRLPPAVPPRGVWSSSLYETSHHVLGVLAGSGVLAGALVWALAAAILPAATSAGPQASRALKVALWAAALVTATALALKGAGGGLAFTSPGTAALGAVGAALLALAPSTAQAWRARQVA